MVLQNNAIPSPKKDSKISKTRISEKTQLKENILESFSNCCFYLNFLVKNCVSLLNDSSKKRRLKTEEHDKKWLYDNSDQKRIRNENHIGTKDKFGPNFQNSAQIISLINLIT